MQCVNLFLKEKKDARRSSARSEPGRKYARERWLLFSERSRGGTRRIRTTFLRHDDRGNGTHDVIRKQPRGKKYFREKRDASFSARGSPGSLATTNEIQTDQKVSGHGRGNFETARYSLAGQVSWKIYEETSNASRTLGFVDERTFYARNFESDVTAVKSIRSSRFSIKKEVSRMHTVYFSRSFNLTWKIVVPIETSNGTLRRFERAWQEKSYSMVNETFTEGNAPYRNLDDCHEVLRPTLNFGSSTVLKRWCYQGVDLTCLKLLFEIN